MDKEIDIINREDNQIISPSTPTPSMTATTDDDESSSLTTTSTESELFDTWTLVTDKKTKAKAKNTLDTATTNTIKETDTKEPFSEETRSHIEILRQTVENTNEPNELKLGHDSSMDDLSDGISIISESESAGCLTPHPYLSERLSSLNLKFTIGDECDLPLSLRAQQQQCTPPNTPTTTNNYDNSNADVLLATVQPNHQLRQRKTRHRSTSRHLEIATALSEAPPPTLNVSSMQLYPLMKRGLTGIFYVGVALAILALIGRWRHGEWQPLSGAGSGDKTHSALEQKVSDMELQNNLMRAEIDILSKQVNYLSSLNEGKQQPSDSAANYKNAKPNPAPQEHFIKRATDWQKERQRREKTFKAWPGNGNGKVVNPVHITKDDLKRAYKCEGEGFVEIAGMCVEKTPKEHEEEALIDQVGNVIEYVVMQQAETLNILEKPPAEEEKNTEQQQQTNSQAQQITAKEEVTTQHQRQEGEKVLFDNEKTQNAEDKRKRYAAEKYAKKQEKYQKDKKKYENYLGNSADHPQQQQYEKHIINNKYEKQQKHEQKSREYKKQQKDEIDEDDDSEEESEDDNIIEVEIVRDTDDENESAEYNESKEKKHHSYSRERFNNNNKNNNNNNNNNNKHFNKQQHYKSKERSYDSKEERNYERQQQQQQYRKSAAAGAAAGDKDGQWQEKLMQNRENARRQNEQKHKQNWYIERADSREYMRHHS